MRMLDPGGGGGGGGDASDDAREELTDRDPYSGDGGGGGGDDLDIPDSVFDDIAGGSSGGGGGGSDAADELERRDPGSGGGGSSGGGSSGGGSTDPFDELTGRDRGSGDGSGGGSRDRSTDEGVTSGSGDTSTGSRQGDRQQRPSNARAGAEPAPTVNATDEQIQDRATRSVAQDTPFGTTGRVRGGRELQGRIAEATGADREDIAGVERTDDGLRPVYTDEARSERLRGLSEQERIERVAQQSDRFNPGDIGSVTVSQGRLQPELTAEARIEIAAEQTGLSAEDIASLQQTGDGQVRPQLTDAALRERAAASDPDLDPEDIVLTEGADGGVTASVDTDAQIQQLLDQFGESRRPAGEGLDPGAGATTSAFADLNEDDFVFEETEDGIQATLTEEAQTGRVREEAAEGLPGVEPDDIVLEETDDGVRVDQAATTEQTLGADEPSDPGAVAETAGFLAEGARSAAPVRGTALGVAAESLRTEDGIELEGALDGTELPGGEDVEELSAQFNPAANRIDMAAEDLDTQVRATLDDQSGALQTAASSLPGLPPGLGAAGGAALSTEFGQGAVGRGVEGGAQALNPARGAQDALTIGEYTIRGTDVAASEGGAAAIQTGGEAAVQLGELAVDEGAPAAVEAAREDPQGAAAVSIGGGLVLGAGLASGAAATGGVRAASGAARRGASGSLSAAQRTGRRVARSDRRPSVSLVEDADAGVFDVRTPDVSDATPGLDDLPGRLPSRSDLPSTPSRETISSPFLDDTTTGRAQPFSTEGFSGSDVADAVPTGDSARAVARSVQGRTRRAGARAQRGLGDLRTDVSFEATRARAALDPNDPFTPAGRVAGRLSDAPGRARQRLRDLRVDTQFEVEQRARALADIDADDVFGGIQRRATVESDSPFLADEGTGRANPLARLPSLSSPSASRPAVSDANLGGLLDDLSLEAPRRPTGPERPGVPEALPGEPDPAGLFDDLAAFRPTRETFSSPFVDDTTTGRAQPFSADLPSAEDARSVFSDVGERLTPSGGVGSDTRLRDLTIRVDLGGRQERRAGDVIDVEDLEGPDEAAGFPRVQDLDVEDYDPGTDIPDSGATGRNTITQDSFSDVGGGQVARIRGRQVNPDAGDLDSMRRVDDLDDGLGDVGTDRFVGGSFLGFGAGEGLDRATDTPFGEIEVSTGSDVFGDLEGDGRQLDPFEDTAGIGDVDAVGVGVGEIPGLREGVDSDQILRQDSDQILRQDLETPTIPGIPTPGGGQQTTPSPRPELPEPEVEPEIPDFEFQTDDELFDSGILSGEEAFESFDEL